MSRLEPFGVFAIRKGYATSNDIQEGVAKQETLERQGRPRPLLGLLLLQMGVLTTDQMIEILKEMETVRARTAQ